MDRVKNFFSKYGLLLLVIVFGSYFGVDIVGGLADSLSSEQTAETLENVVSGAIDGAIAKQIEPLRTDIATLKTQVASVQDSIEQRPDVAVVTLEIELNKFTTAEEVDAMVDEWLEHGWTAQQGLAKYIVLDDHAREALEKQVVYEEVFRRFILRARRIP